MSNTETTTLEEYNQAKSSSFASYSKYKDFSEDWLNKIPEHWEEERLRSQIGYKKGNKPQKTNDQKTEDFEIPYLSMEYLRGEVSQPSYAKNSGDLVIADQDEILLLWDGSKAGEFVEAKPGAVSSTMAKLSMREENNLSYLYYQLKVLEDYLHHNTVGMGIPHVNPRVLKNLHLTIPPREEQDAIVKFLDEEIDNIDKLVKKKEELIELIKEKRDAVVKNAVIKGLDSDVEMRDSSVDWLGEVPEHWDIPRIRFVARMESGHTPSQSEDDYWDGDIPWVSLADSNRMRENDYISETDRQISEEGLANSSARILPSETMVFTRDATVGLCAITTREMAVSQHIIGWICEDDLLAEYLLNVTKAMDQELDRLTMGATISTVGMEDIKKLKIPLPPIEEQEEIVEHLNEELEKFEEGIEKIQDGIERLKEYRSALITNAVTGQIDVRGEM